MPSEKTTPGTKNTSTLLNPVLESPKPAPRITGLAPESKLFTMSDVAGKWVVLYFYPKDMTSGCTLEATTFETLLPELAQLNAVVIGVSKDSCASHAKFSQKEKLSFLLLSDPQGELCERYGAWKEKSMYGRKYMGIERSTFLIDPQGQLVARWFNVKVPGHAAQVLQVLQRLQGK